MTTILQQEDQGKKKKKKKDCVSLNQNSYIVVEVIQQLRSSSGCGNSQAYKQGVSMCVSVP